MRDPASASGDGNRSAGAPPRADRAGSRVALARAISTVENRRPGYRELLHELHGKVGRTHRIGITGPPGAGKSTLVSGLVRLYRERGETVAVIAVDPTSPWTGGALLGDRIRMGDIALDPGVFIRSMATRGSLGGLALATEEVCDVVDAFGFDRIFIETVGVGQTELDIASTADSTLVVLVPESGDGIQAMKAGLMEVADLFVVNKADRPGADRVVREIGIALHLRAGRMLSGVPAHHGVDLSRPAAPAPANAPRPAAWEPPVLLTVAETGRGIAELAAALDRHAIWLERSGERSRRRRRRLAERVRQEVDRALRERVWTERGAEGILESAAQALEHGDASPYEVAARIVQRALDRPGPGPDAESEAGSRGRDSGMTGAGGATGAARDE
jgi:LAO/AO transport system kinase